eukprot:CAMPEP_0185756360 /NCGR_PEP_ID=MMETSP1174-20130828/14788_1 /TAXON_ID=35687 /ORGANISM="Dictyocha speculum, Strain CCMP1381" /LENGTH=170 /DNA_ID=CAMNT_0028435285 /DNA_START=241 /DNA_END=754 /DNA_ORIENTATION=-
MENAVVDLKRNAIVDFRNGEKGIWNYKGHKKAYIEMEVDIAKNQYLLYQIGLEKPRFASYGGVPKASGNIYHVDGFPFLFKKRLIGSFQLTPVIHAPYGTLAENDEIVPVNRLSHVISYYIVVKRHFDFNLKSQLKPQRPSGNGDEDLRQDDPLMGHCVTNTNRKKVKDL